MKDLWQLPIPRFSHLADNQQPFLLHSEKSTKLVVLLHGLAAYPWEMSFFADFLYRNNYSVYVPLIGDFNSLKTFRGFSYQYWLDNTEQIFSELQDYADEIIVLGHSLGGLLAAYASLHFPNIHQIIMVNTVIKLQSPFIPFFPLVYPFWKGIKIKTRPEYRQNYFPYFPVQAVYEVGKLSKMIRNSVPEFSVPVMMVSSESDKTISQKAVKQFYDKLPVKKEFVLLHKAPHSILTPIYKNRIMIYKKILNFIN